MIACMAKIANQRKLPKWLSFQVYKSKSLNICGACMGEICTKYGVSMSNPVLLGVCTDDDEDANDNAGRCRMMDKA